MKALQATALTGPDGVRVVDIAEPGNGEGVLVEVYAAGISVPDLLRTQGLYQDRSDPPFTIGQEFAGTVAKAPRDCGFRVGDRVAGMAPGAAAEMMQAPVASLLRLPNSLSFEQGAALVLNYETALVGLEIRGRMRAGEIVLVHGAAGGTGTAAIQVTKSLGGRAIGVVSTDEKERVAREAGADEVLRSDGPWKDEALQLTDGRGVDLVFDPVGGDRILDTMRSLALNGRWIVVGFVGGAIPQVPLNRVLLRNIDIVGAYYGGYMAAVPEEGIRLHKRLLELLEKGHIRPIIGRVHDLEHGADALRDLAERRALGKVVVTIR